MTLRQVMWGYVEKRRLLGELACLGAALVVAHIPFTGKGLDPVALNPYRVRLAKVSKRLEEVRRFVAGMAFTVLAQRSHKQE